MATTTVYLRKDLNAFKPSEHRHLIRGEIVGGNMYRL